MAALLTVLLQTRLKSKVLPSSKEAVSKKEKSQFSPGYKYHVQQKHVSG